MDQDVKTNRIILIITFIFMLILAGFLAKFYLQQKKENSALRIKLISMSANKRVPTTWQQLSTNKTASTTSTSQPSKAANVPAAEAPEVANVPLPDQPLENLVSELNGNMRTVQTLTPEMLDRNIQLADEILSREPASYSAYKAKLISLLVKEGKHNQEIDDAEVDGLLETMAGFDVNTDVVARREAALLSNANNQLATYQDNLLSVATERNNIDQQMQNLDPSSDEWAVLNEQRAELLKQEEAAGYQLNQFENTVQTSLQDDSYLNEDVVEIPFMRLMAKNDFDAVIENSESFIEQFPTSVSGYYYLVKALEFQGRQDEVAAVISSSQLSPEAQSTLQARLEQTSGTNPKNYWERLRF